MGIAGGPYIVRDSSLVLELDAADRNSYVSGSLAWRDLSGYNNSGSLINGPAFNTGSLGSIVFDGVDDYVTLSSPIIPATGNWTYSSFFYMGALTTGSVFYGQYIAVGSNGRFLIRLSDSTQNTKQFSLFLGSGAGYSNVFIYTNATASINSTYNLSVVRNGQTFSMYVNGVYDTGSTNAFTASLLQTTPIIGGRTNSDINPTPADTDFLTGRVYTTQIYNRALSATEILQNYNQLKSRFNL